MGQYGDLQGELKLNQEARLHTKSAQPISVFNRGFAIMTIDGASGVKVEYYEIPSGDVETTTRIHTLNTDKDTCTAHHPALMTQCIT